MEPRGKALVTDAGTGMGRALAFELASQGFDVIVGVGGAAVGADLVEAARGVRGSLRLQSLDARSLADYEPLRGLRVLVNSIDVRDPGVPIEEADLGQWRFIFESNFFGVLKLTQRVIPRLKEAGGGVICNMCADAAYLPLSLHSAYRASKVALSAVSEALHIELAPHGIRVVEIPIGGADMDTLYPGVVARPSEITCVARNVVNAILADDPLRPGACDAYAMPVLASMRQALKGHA